LDHFPSTFPYGSFGSGIAVEGSYFYDAKQSPIAVYGKANGTRLVLCEISDDREFDRIIIVGYMFKRREASHRMEAK